MRKRRHLVIFGAPGIALAATFIALLLRPSANSAAPQVHERRLVLIAEAKRKQLPDLAGPALTPPPARLGLGMLVGNPVFIDVWTSWCVPCREEAPLLARLWRAYRGKVRFLGIDVEDTRGDARAFVRRYGLGYPNIFDRNASLAGKLGFFGLPTAYLIDGRGRIAARLVGKQSEATLRSGLEALAAEQEAGR